MVELKELLQSDDWKTEKHVPVIDVPEKAGKGEMFDVEVTIGKEVSHPNKTDHHIVWIDLFFHKEGAKFPHHIGRAHFAAHGASAEGPDTSEVYTHHRVVFSMKTDAPGVLLAESYCNIHGLWQSSREISVG